MKKFILFIALLIAGYSVFAQFVPAYIDTNGLLGWYPFNGDATNAYGTGKNGTVMGPVLTTDRFGNPNSAYHFDGMADHIIIDTAFFNVGWSDYTVSLWMNTDSTDNPNNINDDQFSINTIPHNGMGLTYNWRHSGTYNLYANSNPASVSWDILTGVHSHSDISAPHTWNHLVMEKQNDTLYSFYLNGVLDSTYNRTLLAASYFCKIIFGNIDSAMGNEGFWGSLDDYGLWTRALSGCEIKRLFNSSAYLFITAQPTNDTDILSSTVHFSIIDTGAGNTYQWQVDTGSGFTNLSAATPYYGITTPTLTVTSITSVMNGYQYRCIVTGAEGCADISANGKLTIIASTGINNINNKPAISIAPNPTTGHISIIGAGKANVKLYNSIGQVVKEVNQADEISINDLPGGAYLIKLFDAHGLMIYTHEVIKR